MSHRLHIRLPAVLAAGAGSALLAAAPGVASEGLPGQPQFPSGVTPVVIPPVPLPGVNNPPHLRRPRVLRARVTPRRVRAGRRAVVRMTLSSPAPVRVVLLHRFGSRVRSLVVPSGRRHVVLRLALRAHGRQLKPGRYVLRMSALDTTGHPSRTVRRTVVLLRRGG